MQLRFLLLLTITCLSFAGAGCAVLPGLGSEPVAPAPAQQRVCNLTDSVEELKSCFNQASDRVRVVVLLSSTCQTCGIGVDAIRSKVLEEHPEANLQVLVVWIDVGAADNRASAKASTCQLSDPRVLHYHDPTQRVGRIFAEGLLPTGIAWDTYLFYEAGATWEDLPPRPSAWVSQLGRIAGKNFHPRERLQVEIAKLATELLGEPSASR